MLNKSIGAKDTIIQSSNLVYVCNSILFLLVFSLDEDDYGSITWMLDE